MHSLLSLDKVQFDRLNQAIAGIAALPPGQRESKLSLLRALEDEREDIIRCNPSIRSAVRTLPEAA